MKIVFKLLASALLVASTPLLCRAEPLGDPEHMRKCVGFVFVETPDKGMEPIGTGFFVSRTRTNRLSFYFVTANHVLLNPTNNAQYRPAVSVRLMSKEGTFGHFWLPLTTNGLMKV